jgi:arsenite-transporting ATPase
MSYFDLKEYGIVIFDTAPTGHTLRLLELPVDWKGFLDLGTLTKKASEETTRKYSNVIEAMRSKERSVFIFVMYPEYTPIIEAWRASEELKMQVGIQTSLVAVNYILPESYGKNVFFDSRRQQQEKYMAEINERFKTPMFAVPLLEHEPKGLNDLRKLGKKVFGG